MKIRKWFARHILRRKPLVPELLEGFEVHGSYGIGTACDKVLMNAIVRGDLYSPLYEAEKEYLREHGGKYPE